MADLKVDLSSQTLKYIITTQTTVIILMVSWFFVLYPNLVTEGKLKVIAPYVADKELVWQNIRDVQANVKGASEINKETMVLLRKFDERLTLEIRALRNDVTILQTINGMGKKQP